ncbi:hypothetical protein LCGC14_2202780 [marine sediment metagenome]|uniref:Uncharacterized protein n=1 Tax=marine sediment metagenome TaxID=412755 RepID=A0A0F9DG49_9ZZZZ
MPRLAFRKSDGSVLPDFQGACSEGTLILNYVRQKLQQRLARRKFSKDYANLSRADKDAVLADPFYQKKRVIGEALSEPEAAEVEERLVTEEEYATLEEETYGAARRTALLEAAQQAILDKATVEALLNRLGITEEEFKVLAKEITSSGEAS